MPVRHRGACLQHRLCFPLKVADSLDPSSMTPALEGSLEPCFDHPVAEFFAHQVRRQAKDIRVKIMPAHLRRELVVADSSPDSREPVRHDAHSQARPTDQDPSFCLALSHLSGHFRRNLRVLGCLPLGHLHYHDLVTEIPKQTDYPVPNRESAIVGTDCNTHLQSPASPAERPDDRAWIIDGGFRVSKMLIVVAARTGRTPLCESEGLSRTTS